MSREKRAIATEIHLTGFPPTIQITEPLPDNHPIYALIGRVASEWARYESILDTAIWTLAGVPNSVGACVTAQIMGAAPRIWTIRTLAGEKNLLSHIEVALDDLERKTYDPQELRNRTVHDPWFWEYLSERPMQHRSKPRKKPVYGLVPADETQLQELIARILALLGRALALKKTIDSLVTPRPSRGKPA